MSMHRLTRVAALAMAAAFAVPFAAIGQSARVMIGASPAPGQTARLRMTQEMDFELKPIGDQPPGIPKEGIRSKGKSMLLLKQEVGALDANGRLRLDLTYEDVSQELRVNDAPLPIPQDSYDTLRGRTVTMWIGKDNEVLDVTAPENFPIPQDQLKQFLGPLVASVPHQEMSVGETVTLPFSMALPIPVPAGGAPPMLVGQTKTTLTRLTAEAGDQVATLDQTMTVAFDSSGETTMGRNVRMDMKIVASGTTDTFVRGGLVKSNAMNGTISGQFAPGGKSGSSMKLTGTLTMTVERVP
jgi:hypothetical protein